MSYVRAGEGWRRRADLAVERKRLGHRTRVELRKRAIRRRVKDPALRDAHRETRQSMDGWEGG